MTKYTVHPAIYLGEQEVPVEFGTNHILWFGVDLTPNDGKVPFLPFIELDVAGDDFKYGIPTLPRLSISKENIFGHLKEENQVAPIECVVIVATNYDNVTREIELVLPITCQQLRFKEVSKKYVDEFTAHLWEALC